MLHSITGTCPSQLRTCMVFLGHMLPAATASFLWKTMRHHSRTVTSISPSHMGLAREATPGAASEATCGWQLHCKPFLSVLASYFPTTLEWCFTKPEVA